MGGRRTNLALLGLLAVAFLTGWLAFSFFHWSSRVVLVVHGVAGLAIVGLLPWKSLLARRSLSGAAAAGWLLGGALGLLLLVSLAFGLLHSGGLPYLWTTPLLSSGSRSCASSPRWSSTSARPWRCCPSRSGT